MEEKSDKDKFENELRTIGVFAFEHGTNTVGLVLPKDGKKKYKKFICACHVGYGLAQDRIIEGVTSIETELKELKAQLRKARRERRAKDIEKISARIEVLHYRVVVLKKIADSLAWLFMNFEGWIIRRHCLGIKKGYLVDSNIASAKEAAGKINSNPLCFALICDLTTCFQLCDLIEIDFSDITKPKKILIELKEGEMNEKVLDMLESYSITQCDRALYLFAKVEGKKALGQLARVAKQHYRMAELNTIIKTGKGKDLITGKEINIPDKYYIEEDYFEEFNDMVKLCRKEKNAVTCIDDCLFVGMFDTETFGSPQFAFKHAIYHLLNRGEECRLDRKGNEALNEIRKIASENYKIMDLRTGFYTPIATPLYLWPIDKEAMFDIIFGRIVVLSYLDIDKLFQIASVMGLEAGWTKVQSGRSDYFTRLGKRPFIKKGEEVLLMGDSTLGKIYFDGIRPVSIVKVWNERLSEL